MHGEEHPVLPCERYGWAPAAAVMPHNCGAVCGRLYGASGRHRCAGERSVSAMQWFALPQQLLASVCMQRVRKHMT